MRWFSVVAMCLALSCANVLDIDEYPYARAPFAALECRTCAEAQCAATERACASDSRCAGALRCISQCKPNDPACRYDCELADTTTAASALYLAADTCRRRACTNECPGLSGFGATVDPGCGCLDTDCAPELTRCVANGDCERMGSCTVEGGLSPAAAFACVRKHGAGLTDFLAFRECFMSRCKSCPLHGGGVYACSGDYIYDKPVAPRVKLTIKLGSLEQASIPIASVAATACETSQCTTCSSGGQSVAKGTTDDKGMVTLDVPTGAEGFRGCVHFGAKPGYTDVLYYPGHPVIADEFIDASIMIPDARVNETLKLNDVTLLPGYGALLYKVNDCVNSPSAGMRATLDGQDGNLLPFYSVAAELRPGSDGTGTTGIGAFLNVVGDAAPTLRIFRGDREVTTFRVWVRKDPISGGQPRFMTYVNLLPSPR